MSRYKPYPKYKDSGIEWLGEIPEDWENYRIDWINTIIRGNTGFTKDELLEYGEFVALQYGKTYKVDEVNETFEFYVNSEFYKKNQVVNYGDIILISTSETIEDLGHSCFYNRKDLGLIGGEQILLKPNTKFIFDKYLYYYSKVFCNELRKYATGLKVFRFSIDDLKNIFIFIPSLHEQQQIAQYLDEKTSKIDTLITKATKAIELLKERRTALISAVVTGKIDIREEQQW
jgi:type I restriction enzyme S subunit